MPRENQYAQAKSDYQAVNQTTPAFALLFVALLFVAFLGTSIIGAQINFNIYPQQKAFLRTLFPQNNNVASSTPIIAPANTNLANRTVNSTVSSNTAVNSINSSNDASEEALKLINSNVEPESLSTFERDQMADKLFQVGIKFTKSSDYADAEKFYRKAILFDPDQANYHHELGYSLYRQKKYQESIIVLKQAIQLKSLNSETKEILAKNYLALQNWSEASEILQDVTTQNPGSAQNQYNLGQAFKNAGKIDSAITALQNAAKLKPKDANTHYELGLCYFLTGQSENVRDEYLQLLALNPSLAEKLNQRTHAVQLRSNTN